MRGKDFDGKRVRYQGKEWLVTGRRTSFTDTLTLTETGQPIGQPCRVVEVPEGLWQEIEVLGDG